MRTGINLIISKGISKLKFLYHYYKSLLWGWLKKNEYKNIHSFVLFIGYPRSGHSLIGALLDAHPNIVMGMEWGVLSHFKAGYRKNQILYSLTQNAKAFTKNKKNVWTGYSYKINGFYQGNYSNIQVIGDKFGSIVAKHLIEEPDILKDFSKEISKQLCFIHVIRNPFDTISTMAKRFLEKKYKKKNIDIIDLLPFIKIYFEKVKAIENYKSLCNKYWFDLYHEKFIENPRKILEELMHFLKLPIDYNYIAACEEIIFQEPHKSRVDAPWTKELVVLVENEMKKYKFLSHYNFTN